MIGLRKNKYISVTIPEKLLKVVNDLVNEGEFASMSDFVNDAVRYYLDNKYPLRLYKRGEKDA